MSGVGLEAYWFSSYVWDFVSYLVPMSLAIILFKLADVDALLDNGADGALVLLFLLFGLSMVRSGRRLSVSASKEYEVIDPCLRFK